MMDFPFILFCGAILIGIILFVKVLIDRLSNKEDKHYSKTVDK